jgi:hypothetical protein
MPASRSVVSTLLRELGDVSLHPQGRPCGRQHGGHQGAGLTVQASWRRHYSLIDTSFSPGLGPHRGYTAGPPGTTAVNDGRSSSQVSRPIQETMLVGQPPRFSLARRKPRVQNPLTSTTSTDVNPPRMLDLLGAPHGGRERHTVRVPTAHALLSSDEYRVERRANGEASSVMQASTDERCSSDSLLTAVHDAVYVLEDEQRKYLCFGMRTGALAVSLRAPRLCKH